MTATDTDALIERAHRLRSMYSTAMDSQSGNDASAKLAVMANYGELSLVMLGTLATALRTAQADNARMREALTPFVRHYEPWMERMRDDENMSTFPRHTMGELRKARAALPSPPETSEAK